MATILPPPSKRQKLAADAEKQKQEEDARIPGGLGTVRVQFVDQATGQPTGAPVALPVAQANPKNLELLLNSLQGRGDDAENPKIPYRFSFQPTTTTTTPTNPVAVDITTTIYHTLLKPGLRSTEDLITLHYTPLSVFRVRAVTRCAAAISGHGEPILAVQFSPQSSSRMVSGSGDCTARIWDSDTNTPYKTLTGHTGWVLAVAYSPDGATIATGSHDRSVRLFSSTGTPLLSGKPLKGHTGYITSLAWEPYHLSTPQRRLASASKDATVRIWDTIRGIADIHLTRHTSTVSCVRWGGSGSGVIYTASHDKTVKVWDPHTGALLKSLDAHAHWVNHLALSSDHVLRTSFYDHNNPSGRAAPPTTDPERRALALSRFETATRENGQIVERLVTASDDNTLYLWQSTDLKKPVARLLGHQKPINHTTFSPNGAYIASSSFDGLIKLWRASDGLFLRNLKAHVAAVYMVAFSADSRMLVSASKDMTLKVWEVSTGKMVEDLTGGRGEVYAVDWAGDGGRVGSGGADRMVRFWTN